MKIGIDSYSYHRFFGEIYPNQKDPGILWNLRDFISQISTLPIEALALETCFLPSREEEIIQATTLLNVEMMFAWGHPDGFMGETQEEAVSEIEKYLTLSKKLGFRVMRIVGSSILHFREPHGPQVKIVKNTLRRIIPIAQACGVKLSIENHADFYTAELLEILNDIDSPFLGVTLDTGNCLRLKEDPVKAIRLFKEKVSVVHAKDVAPISGLDPEDPMSLACVPAGEGITDFKSIIAALDEINYRGMVLIEISRLHPNYESMDETQVIARGLSYLYKSRKDGGWDDAKSR
jgi:sugar phosphate isomerase/epimerase